MSTYAGLGDLVEQIKQASRDIEAGDARTSKRLDGVENSINDLFRKVSRPGNYNQATDDEVGERKSATEMCHVRRALSVPKVDGLATQYEPGAGEVDEALIARKALKALWRHGDVARLDQLERKSLSAFSFGNSGFLLAPEMSNQVLSCLVDPTDVSGLVNRVQISAGSIKFLIDHSRMADAAWACQASCFANNPQPDLQAGLGELEIKAEPLRFIACANSDLLQDASFNVETWLFEKVSLGCRRTLNDAILLGDGVGKPLGMLSPNAGIPVCETSPATQPGQFTWQDLVMLKYEIPMQWQAGASFLMNQRTLALLLTMSDSGGRPMWSQLPGGQPGFTLAGSPIQIVTQMPDVAPGATPIAFGNWRQVYLLVDRQATTMLPDPYSAGFCHLYKFEARVGGGVLCPNAARLLRIR